MSTLGNGNSPPVPDDIVWDEENPPLIYSCSQHIEHARFCNGECPTYVANELQVQLMNEARAWARAGMSFHGIPAAYRDQIPIQGINVELFDLECRVHVLCEILVEMFNVDGNEIDERYGKFKLMALRNIREENEANVRRQRAANALGIAQKKPIIGPDGQPLL
jgi:hypothetical protein